METPSRNDSPMALVDISDIIVFEDSSSSAQGRQLWMRPEQDVGH